MKAKKKIIIIGSGGHAKVIADIILKRKEELKEDIELKGFLDDKYNDDNELKIFDIPVIGKVDKIKDISKEDIYFIIGIGNNEIREKISKSYKVNYFTAIHPKATIANKAKIKEGSVVMANAVINSYTEIGKHCIINTGSIIEHDNIIEDFVHISPNVTLAGGVKVGQGSWIGIGASVIEGIKIGSRTMIGAGSVVIKDIEDNKKAFGVPCKER